MRRKSVKVLLVMGILVLIGRPALAHVPYFERKDFSDEKPFEVPYKIEQSLAVYAWLETDGLNPSTDIDVYRFEVNESVRVYLEVLVPVCEPYADFFPSFALVGPGLPDPDEALPFSLPPSYGAVVMMDELPGSERDTFYEPFGGKSYYQGPVFDAQVGTPGTYYVYFWDPYEKGGDYVAVFGRREIWRPQDIIRALIYTPLIRRDKELHVECSE